MSTKKKMKWQNCQCLKHPHLKSNIVQEAATAAAMKMMRRTMCTAVAVRRAAARTVCHPFLSINPVLQEPQSWDKLGRVVPMEAAKDPKVDNIIHGQIIRNNLPEDLRKRQIRLPLVQRVQTALGRRSQPAGWTKLSRSQMCECTSWLENQSKFLVVSPLRHLV